MSLYISTNPTTGETLAEFDTLDDAGVEQALAAAHTGYEAWRAVPVAERAAVLSAISQAYTDRAEELATLMAREMGKPCARRWASSSCAR